MEDIVMNTSNITNYKPKDFAELLGVSVKTLQRWDREGILKANRTPTDRRYYTYDQYLKIYVIYTIKFQYENTSLLIFFPLVLPPKPSLFLQYPISRITFAVNVLYSFPLTEHFL